LFCSSEDFNEEKTKEFEIIVITFLKDNKRKVCLTEILEHEALKKTVKSVKHDPYMIGTTIEQKELVGKYFYLD
ncbi:MAG: hypothetical protein NZZ41_07640, partial [Candidatus Dojkabacteria bacterium]|nr:hypothetical protein [Candidatus Dojkabacteria bacterium]